MIPSRHKHAIAVSRPVTSRDDTPNERPAPMSHWAHVTEVINHEDKELSRGPWRVKTVTRQPRSVPIARSGSTDLFFEISFERDSYRILLLSHCQCCARSSYGRALSVSVWNVGAMLEQQSGNAAAEQAHSSSTGSWLSLIMMSDSRLLSMRPAEHD